MSVEIQEPPQQQSTAALVGGILADLQTLVEKQFRVTRLEIEGELRRRAAAAAVLVVGLALCLVSVIVISLGLVHLLHAVSTRGTVDTSSIPFWACYEIVGAALLVIGGLIANAAKSSLTKPKTN